MFFGENGDLIAFFYALKFHSELPKNNEIRGGKKHSITLSTSNSTTTEQSEIWKDITGYKGLYQVSNWGRIKSLPRIVKFGNQKRLIDEKILSPRNHTRVNNAYQTIILYKGNQKSKTFYVHRLVAKMFVKGFFHGADVNHIDGNKSNNKSSNLEWCTRKENINHALKVLGVIHGDYSFHKRWNSKPIVQLDLEGNKIADWTSAYECMRKTGIPEANIRRCMMLKGLHVTRGYKWYFADDYYKTPNKSVFAENKIKSNPRSMCVMVKDVNGNTCKKYQSMRQLAKVIGCCSGTIRKYKDSGKEYNGKIITSC